MKKKNFVTFLILNETFFLMNLEAKTKWKTDEKHFLKHKIKGNL